MTKHWLDTIILLGLYSSILLTVFIWVKVLPRFLSDAALPKRFAFGCGTILVGSFLSVLLYLIGGSYPNFKFIWGLAALCFFTSWFVGGNIVVRPVKPRSVEEDV